MWRATPSSWWMRGRWASDPPSASASSRPVQCCRRRHCARVLMPPAPQPNQCVTQTVLTASLAFDIIDRIRRAPKRKTKPQTPSTPEQRLPPLPSPHLTLRRSGGTLGIDPPEWVKTQIVAPLVEPPGIWFLFNMGCMLALCLAVAAGASPSPPLPLPFPSPSPPLPLALVAAPD
jgi:hypothetical protein